MQRETNDLRFELKTGQFETDENYLHGIPKPCAACSIHARGTISNTKTPRPVWVETFLYLDIGIF